MEEKINPIYDPEQGPMHVVAFFSGGASGVKYLLDRSDCSEIENDNYAIVGGFTDREDAEGRTVLENNGIETKYRPYDSSAEYYEQVLYDVEEFDPDLIVLSGFMRIVKEPLLSEYENKIINVHPADLRVKEEGEKKFKGDDAVYDAIVSGEKELRSSVHMVTEDLDEGPLLAVSRAFPIVRDQVRTLKKKNKRELRNYADSVQEWMKWEGDGPCLSKALQLLSEGKIGEGKSGIFIREADKFKSGYYDLEEDKIRII